MPKPSSQHDDDARARSDFRAGLAALQRGIDALAQGFATLYELDAEPPRTARHRAFRDAVSHPVSIEASGRTDAP
jgi:hypothetical protein